MTRKNESTTDLGSFLCALFGVAIVVLLPEHGAMATEGTAEDSGREESNSSAPADARLPADVAPFFLPPRELTGDFGEYRSPLTFYDGRTVENAADWDERRREILGRWHEIMGAWPPLIEKPEITYLDKERRENLAQHRIRLEVAPGGRTVEGYLLVPDGKGPFPAVVVVYYDAKTGIGLGKELRDFGYQLAKRGFVALSIGTPISRYYPDQENAQLQPLSALAYAAANCYNALANLPNVDPQRVGIVGHSYGGKWAMFASCLYEKFACAAWSDGGIVFDEKRSNVNYWEPWYLGYERGETRERGIPSEDNPRIGAYRRLVEAGHDLHELHALMAPRPFLVSGGSEDRPERWRALQHALAVNRLLGATNRVAMTNRRGHSPTAESNQQLYRFFEHFLKDLTRRTSAAPASYFPPPESKGGWRRLADPDAIRRIAGMDPNQLTEVKEWLLKSDRRNFAAVVIRRGYILLEVERENSSRTDARRVASVSKAICATVLAIASERSQRGLTPQTMKFDDPAFEFIPWAKPLSDPRKAQIKVKQLFNHTSGICPEATGASNRGTWDYILGHSGDPRTAQLAFDPGTASGYSTHALHHASLVCETVTGMKYDEFARKELFQPLGIEHWWFQYFDGGDTYGRHPSHGMGMPARDLARVAYCMLRDGRWRKTQVIPRWFVEETAAPTHTVKGPEMRFKINAQTFSHGWQLPARLDGAAGRGFPPDARYKPGSGGQLIAFVPSLDLVVTRQTGSSGGWEYEEYLRLACRAVLKDGSDTQ